MKNILNDKSFLRKKSLYRRITEAHGGASMDFSNRTKWSESLVGRAINKMFSFVVKNVHLNILKILKNELDSQYLKGIIVTIANNNEKIEQTEKSSIPSLSFKLINKLSYREIVPSKIDIVNEKNINVYFNIPYASLIEYKLKIMSENNTKYEVKNIDKNTGLVLDKNVLIEAISEDQSLKINYNVIIDDDLDEKSEISKLYNDTKKQIEDEKYDKSDEDKQIQDNEEEEEENKNVSQQLINDIKMNVDKILKIFDSANLNVVEALNSLKIIINNFSYFKSVNNNLILLQYVNNLISEIIIKLKKIINNSENISNNSELLKYIGVNSVDDIKNKYDELLKLNNTLSNNLSTYNIKIDNKLIKNISNEIETARNITNDDIKKLVINVKKQIIKYKSDADNIKNIDAETEDSSKTPDKVSSDEFNKYINLIINQTYEILENIEKINDENSKNEIKNILNEINDIIKDFNNTKKLDIINNFISKIKFIINGDDEDVSLVETYIFNYTKLNEFFDFKIKNIFSPRERKALSNLKSDVRKYYEIPLDRIDFVALIKKFRNNPKLVQEAINNVNKPALKEIALRAKWLYDRKKYIDENNILYSRVNFTVTHTDLEKIKNEWKRLVESSKSLFFPFYAVNGVFPDILDPIHLIENDSKFQAEYSSYAKSGVIDNNSNLSVVSTINFNTNPQINNTLKIVNNTSLSHNQYGLMLIRPKETILEYGIFVRKIEKNNLHFYQFLGIYDINKIFKDVANKSNEDEIKKIIQQYNYSTKELCYKNIKDKTEMDSFLSFYDVLYPIDYNIFKNKVKKNNTNELFVYFVSNENIRRGNKNVFHLNVINNKKDLIDAYVSFIHKLVVKDYIEYNRLNVNEVQNYYFKLSLNDIFLIKDEKYWLTDDIKNKFINNVKQDIITDELTHAIKKMYNLKS